MPIFESFSRKNYTVLCAFVFFFVACKEEAPPIGNIERTKLGAETVIEPEIIYSDSARVRVRVTGPSMTYFTDEASPRQEFKEGVRVFFYDENQIQQSVLSGKYAIREERARKVTVRDSVVWESVTDGKLETSELIWDEVSNVIRSTKFTKITRKNEIIYGFNFETDDKLTHWRILSPKGSMQVQDLEKQVQ
jgi:LPS export ABC transporter protein LptC